MRRPFVTFLLWLTALIITLGLAVFQRLTGPTYPLRGSLDVGSETITFRFLRSHGDGDMPVRIEVGESDLEGTLLWRRYPTDEEWRSVPLIKDDGALAATIPHQPPAGKVEYRLILESGSGERYAVPEGESVVARYKGEVPIGILIPHVIAMFASMLFSTRALLEVFRRDGRAGAQVITAMVLLVLGGLILGPTVQKYAFGAFWTGWPFGEDFTDNKTLVAVLAWLPATIAAFRRRPLRRAVILGWIVMMGVFLVPHSFRGSQIDWSKVPTE
jgi:hypothetical protein